MRLSPVARVVLARALPSRVALCRDPSGPVGRLSARVAARARTLESRAMVFQLLPRYTSIGEAE